MKRLTFLALCAVFPLLLGCASESDQTADGASQPFPYLRLAPTPPPPPEPESVPSNDEPQKQVWRPGYWSYDGVDFEWNPGAFIARPNPTAVWARERWDKHVFGWSFVPGRWQ